MKTFFFVSIITCCLIMGCAVLKKNPTATPQDMSTGEILNGEWRLNYIASSVSFETLYSRRVPIIKFDIEGSKVNGNTGCNTFFGKVIVDGNKISFPEPIGMTKMACEGQGEQTFISTLKKVDKFEAGKDGKTLNLIAGDIAVMKLSKK